MPRHSVAAYADDPSEPDRCHARAKSHGGRCGNKAEPGYTVCELHGGKTPRGRDAWNRLGEEYAQVMADPATLLDLTRPLAALDTVVQRRMDKANELDTPEFRQRALALYRDAQSHAGTEPVASARSLSELGKLLERGGREDAAIDRMKNAVIDYARRLEAAWNIRLSRENVINKRDLVALFVRFANIVNAELDDPAVAHRLMERIHRDLVASGREADVLGDAAHAAVVET